MKGSYWLRQSILNYFEYRRAENLLGFTLDEIGATPGKSSSCLVMRPWTDSEKTPWAGRRPRSLSSSNQRCYATLKGAEGDLEL
jgi:hypothetical protein